MDFIEQSIKNYDNWTSKPISYHVDGVDARGGASLLKTENTLFLFGGADRGQCHFSDLWMYQKSDTSYDWFKGDSSGDVPTPRSGHATVLYDGNMLLFGGIDYSEEAVYNDLYCLDLETLEWKYIGEAGEEVIARNSHSLGVVIGSDENNYLVIYGGASPSEGPLADTYYANLSDLKTGMFVKWIRMDTSTDSSPGPREMHSTCCHNGRMYIAGGRSETEVLSDVWCLGPIPASPDSSTSCADATLSDGLIQPSTACPLSWIKVSSLSLDAPRCAHGAAIVTLPSISATTSDIVSNTTTETNVVAMCLLGGFTGAGVSADLIIADMSSVVASSTSSLSSDSSTTSPCRWRTANVKGSVPPRFGLAMCVAPDWMTPGTSSPVSDSTVSKPGIVVFGGVNAERDLNDFWILNVDV